MTDFPDIATIEAAIVEEFSLFENSMDKYEYIIELGKDLPPLPEEARKEENIVKGCQSTVWLTAILEGDRVVYQADSNTVITKGIIALLIRVLSNQRPEEILSAKLNFIEKIDLHAHLSSQRSNGLKAMIQQMKNYALAFKTILEKQT